MRQREVTCTNCKASLAPDLWDGEFHQCPRCLETLQVYPFPALLREQPASLAEAVLVEGESSCFYHPQKKAIVACESCGRFLCALCDVEISGSHHCPGCLEAGKQKRGAPIAPQFVRFDRIALALTTVTLLFWPLTIVTAPAALFIVIRFWNRRSSVLPGSRVTFILAGVLALAETGGWAFLLYRMIHGWRM